MTFRHILLTLLISTSIFAQESWTSEDILIMNDSIKLPGTLTYNKDLKEQPLVIFVPGSGNPDRNGNQPQYGVNGNYIKQFSDALNAKDIAFFRYDKRNVTRSNIKHILKSYVFNDLVKDVHAIIDAFKNDKRFNNITLVGHSQGSLVAMLASNEHIDNYVSLAGLGETADKAIIRQLKAQNEAYVEIATAHIDELKTSGTIKEINPLLMALFAKQNHEFLLSYMDIDPTVEIKKLHIPILILNGNKDIQVLIDDAKNLHDASPNSKMAIIDKMNHVLKIIEKDEDNFASYSSPDFKLSEELVNTIEAFVKQ